LSNIKQNNNNSHKLINHLLLLTMEKKKTPAKKTVSKNSKMNDDAKNSMPSSALMKLFEDELKDIYWAEKALLKAIPKMIDNATSEELIEALTNHLAETEEQVSRVEQVFESFDKKAKAVKCDAMEGLIKEAESIMEECEPGAMCDAGIISAGQKIEHYEIASYGTLRQFAETLGLEEAAELLQITLDEEKAADETLTEVAVSAINVEAAEMEDSE
jgi:ferritin-like metal-binding protein YciE